MGLLVVSHRDLPSSMVSLGEDDLRLRLEQDPVGKDLAAGGACRFFIRLRRE